MRLDIPDGIHPVAFEARCLDADSGYQHCRGFLRDDSLAALLDSLPVNGWCRFIAGWRCAPCSLQHEGPL